LKRVETTSQRMGVEKMLYEMMESGMEADQLVYCKVQCLFRFKYYVFRPLNSNRGGRCRR
jgi:hypothetical protein